MRRRVGLPALCLALLVLATATASAGATTPTGSTPVNCAQIEKTTIAPSGSPPPQAKPSAEPPCWEEIQPYPFGVDGGYVGEPSIEPGPCSPGGNASLCYLKVNSMAFRAWNRGLAATSPIQGPPEAGPGVWVFDGTSWSPSPNFPGKQTCPGNTVVWAGKLDYWLVGQGLGGQWPGVCRFDGFNNKWQPLPLPEATQHRVAGHPGSITSAACFAWNNCWFFGTYGVVVHWNGEILEDASPPLSERWLHGEYTQAVARENLSGEPFGVAVGDDQERLGSTEKLPPETEKGRATAPQMYGSQGGAFSPLAFAPPANEPLGIDLIAADFDPAERGWVVGNPGGLRLRQREEGEGGAPQPQVPPERHLHVTSSLAPLEPLSASGESTSCTVPNFEYEPEGAADPAGSFLWSALSVVPSSGEALAGGDMRQLDPSWGEPVIAQVGCDGTATLTRFRAPEPNSSAQPAPLVPADRGGSVTAIAANATNDAWAATSEGSWPGATQFPRLYRLRNGRPPEAPEGNDNELRPLDLHEELLPPPQKPPPPEEPAPTPAPEAPPSVSQLPSVTLPPAIYDVKVKLHKLKRHRRTYLSLYLTFKVLRPVTIGAQALRNGRVVSRARARLFAGTTGTLILSVERKRWPNAVRFIS